MNLKKFLLHEKIIENNFLNFIIKIEYYLLLFVIILTLVLAIPLIGKGEAQAAVVLSYLVLYMIPTWPFTITAHIFIVNKNIKTGDMYNKTVSTILFAPVIISFILLTLLM